MIPELGHFVLVLALCVVVIQSVIPLAGATLSVQPWINLARPTAYAQFICVSVAFLCLTISFINDDFSVQYVASNSNSQLPLMYKISAVWGAHEGSVLLWALVLSTWTTAVAIFSKTIPQAMLARVISVMGMISLGFLLFILLTSNPFSRLIPAPFDGSDLNPLLQDPGLAIHPPMLYMGYVGFSVPFAFAVAALLGGQLDTVWARWSRPWTNMAWIFLTLGITLGSWWAYYELGWGGWWFWDPVENASFMPWLVGTALIHSLAATDKRGVLHAWTVLLAIFAFSLSLLGTFLVRSGVLTSVHAFATDPTRGVFILIFLALVIGLSLLLYSIRAAHVKSPVSYELVSRETFLLINNILLVVAAASILLGTLYPLIIDAMQMGKISVGPPYFNAVFIPLMAPLAILVGLGVRSRWRKDSLIRLLQLTGTRLLFSVITGLLLTFFLPYFSISALIADILAVWVVVSGLDAVTEHFRQRGFSFRTATSIPLGFYGMTIAHLGIAVFIIGIALTSEYSIEKDVRLSPGSSIELGDYQFTLTAINQIKGPNYRAHQGVFSVTSAAGDQFELQTQKRIYNVRNMPMTEAGIDAALTRDLFIAMGEQLDQPDTWSVRVYVKPFVRWIWLGGVFMACGGLIATLDPRYRKQFKHSTIKNNVRQTATQTI
ncbi:MAG: heme lyase CcmF/NrfE family subunit [Gammaproteobacteria bacterium]|nr:heme lyase CcmF/NrfE family subunit [Gammaproteobacteria bacterium]